MKNIFCECPNIVSESLLSISLYAKKGIEETLQILWIQTKAEDPDPGSALFLWFRWFSGVVPSTTSINVTDHKGNTHWEWFYETEQNRGINFTRVCINMKIYCTQYLSPSQFIFYLQLNAKWHCWTITAVLNISFVCTNAEAMPSVSDATETARPWVQSFSFSCKIEAY